MQSSSKILNLSLVVWQNHIKYRKLLFHLDAEFMRNSLQYTKGYGKVSTRFNNTSVHVQQTALIA